MLVLAQDALFDAPVSLTAPGTSKQVETRFTFRALTTARTVSLLILAQAIKRSRAVRAWHYTKLCWRAKKIAGITEMLDELITGWNGIDVSYSKASLHTLLRESPNAHIHILTAYLKHQEEARIKN